MQPERGNTSVTARLRRVVAPFAAAPLILAAACGSASRDGSTAGGNIATTPATSTVALSETGSTLLYPLFSEWGPAFNQKYPNVTVTTQGSGSGAGIAQVAAGAVDIGGSDAYLAEGETKEHPGLMNIALAIAAQQINYNLPGVPAHLKLNGHVLAGMYQGTVKSWNDPQLTALNPGVNLPDTPVVPLHRSDGSGDTFVFTQYLSKQDPDGWGRSPGFGTTVDFPAAPATIGENGNGAMVTGCAQTPGCVAYISIGLLDDVARQGLGQAKLENAAGNYLLPDPASIQAAAAALAAQTPADQAISLIDGPAPNGYPIVNYEYAIVNRSQHDQKDKAAAVQAFLHWALTDGSSPAFLDKVHLQPLPDPVVQQSIAQLAKVGVS